MHFTTESAECYCHCFSYLFCCFESRQGGDLQDFVIHGWYVALNFMPSTNAGNVSVGWCRQSLNFLAKMCTGMVDTSTKITEKVSSTAPAEPWSLRITDSPESLLAHTLPIRAWSLACCCACSIAILAISSAASLDPGSSRFSSSSSSCCVSWSGCASGTGDNDRSPYREGIGRRLMTEGTEGEKLESGPAAGVPGYAEFVGAGPSVSTSSSCASAYMS